MGLADDISALSVEVLEEVGESIRIDGQDGSGFFSRGSDDDGLAGDPGRIVLTPRMTVHLSQFPEVLVNSAIERVAAEEIYKVAEIEGPDSNGWLVLILER